MEGSGILSAIAFCLAFASAVVFVWSFGECGSDREGRAAEAASAWQAGHPCLHRRRRPLIASVAAAAICVFAAFGVLFLIIHLAEKILP